MINQKNSFFVNENEVKYDTDAENGYEAFSVSLEDFKDILKSFTQGKTFADSVLGLAREGKYNIIFGLAVQGINFILEEFEKNYLEELND